jgi:hypothetical protein
MEKALSITGPCFSGPGVMVRVLKGRHDGAGQRVDIARWHRPTEIRRDALRLTNLGQPVPRLATTGIPRAIASATTWPNGSLGDA